MTLRDHLGPRTDATAALHDELDRLEAAPAAVLALWEPVLALIRDYDESFPYAQLEGDDEKVTALNSAIRALATPDSTAALKRVIDKALEMAKKVGDVVEHTDRPNWASEGAWAHCAEIYTIRIASITADDVLRELGGRGTE